ncbi:hypothetical protein HOLleu_38343 [Holothuria leucospilota]|uniref:Uncharacterized protein n=1 Tax=Holothuria leucospilota TaxID=206669 RepID=A0A9Q1BE13_HOLLE|nr:hypothetical protein HOLleu_38343 [Holothuria leucospilota]
MSDNQTLQSCLALVFLSHKLVSIWTRLQSGTELYNELEPGNTQDNLQFTSKLHTPNNVTMSTVALLFPGEDIGPRKKQPTVPVMLKLVMIILGNVSLKPPSRIEENVFDHGRRMPQKTIGKHVTQRKRVLARNFPQ